MKLAQLLTVFSHLKWGDNATRDVSSICFDSRKLEMGCVFVAIRGTKVDGHQFLEQAMAAGAIALVVDDESLIPKDFTGAVVKVSDTRLALNQLCSRYFDEPSQKLFCVGVTGTNGKTTTTNMIEAILNEYGWDTGVIGTINHHLKHHVWETEMTTPDPLQFQRRLSEFLALGARALAMEVSSHALKQSRVDEVEFDVAVFSNLTRDHLDYHPDMEDYFSAKARLFSTLLAQSRKPARVAILNADDPFAMRIHQVGDAKIWTYGQNNADFQFEILELAFGGSRFRLKTPVGEQVFELHFPAIYNVYNAVSAIAVGVAAGCSLQTCAQALDKLSGVAGRLQPVRNSRGVHVFVDYAHSDAALTSVLASLNSVRSHGKLKNQVITVFGCGGDRDRGKRPLMMQAAEAGSDLVIVTSDNPRTEDPEQIIRDAISGCDPQLIGKKVLTEVDRRKAIHLALQKAKPGDVVLIAGKGHETYQQIGNSKQPFSDVEVVKEFWS